MTKDAVLSASQGEPPAGGNLTDPSSPDQRPAGPSDAAIDTLKQAMRRARADSAEHAGVTSDLRAARLGRLELLHEALKPLLAQIPAEVETFDVGLLPGTNPRLFIDMIGFVEMGRDGRLYRLLQDTRNGRIVLKESEEVGITVDAITDYVARRLLERERALAADVPPPAALASRRAAAHQGAVPGQVAPAGDPAQQRPAHAQDRPHRRRGAARFVGIAFSFLIDLLGFLTMFTVVALGLWFAWTRLHGAS